MRKLRVVAESSKEAFSRVSRELGPDAEVISKRRIEGPDGRDLYEVIGQANGGGGQTRAVSGKGRSRAATLVLALIALASVVAILLLAQNREQRQVSAKPIRIAILPFKNIGPADKGYFADGICEEITTRLSQIDGLGVISRTSTQQYRNSDKDIGAIAAELEVEYLLEGSVRWQQLAEGRVQVRISPQLIRASDGVHIWAEVFEEDLSNIFRVQENISDTVAEMLGLELKGAVKQQGAKPPTENMEAYNYYLIGLENKARSLCKLSTEMFQKAVEIDPEFALAWAWLSAEHSVMYSSGLDPSEERKRLAWAAYERSVQLAPDLPEGFWARALYHYYCEKDLDEALKYLRISGQHWKNSAEIYINSGYIYRSQERYDLAIECFQKAAELAPRNSKCFWDVGHCYHMLHEYDEAERYFGKSRSIAPDAIRPYQWLHNLHIARDGNIDAARVVLEESRANLPSLETGFKVEVWIFFREYLLHLFEHRYEEALVLIDNYEEEYQRDYYPSAYYWRPLGLLRAQVYILLGREREAKEGFEEAVGLLEAKLIEYHGEDKYMGPLGIALAGLGRRQEAVDVAGAAVEFHVERGSMGKARHRQEDLAQVYTLLGEEEKAIALLEELLSAPGELSTWWLKLDPKWDPLRENPRFERLIAAGDKPIDPEQWRPAIN